MANVAERIAAGAATDNVMFLLSSLFGDIFVLCAFGAAFAASLFWLATMTKFELSYAYPVMAMSFVLVFIFSVIFPGETISAGKIAGILLILMGITAVAKL